MILHPNIVVKSIYGHYRSSLKSVIVNSPFNDIVRKILPPKGSRFSGEKIVNAESVTERHLRICKFLHQEIQNIALTSKEAACEIGAGECLASSDLLLGTGFKKVYVIEKPAQKIDAALAEILREVASHSDLPNNLDSLTGETGNQLNTERVIQVEKYFEDTELPEPVDLIVSFDVLEHVENLPAFFQNCYRSLRDGGVMIHKFDLSGHSLLEDPIPPLDFQTYPDWLYALMYPKFGRAVRNFVSTFADEIERQGFQNIQITPILKADPAYVSSIWPHLRKAAKALTPEEVSILDVVLTASKK